MKTLWIFLCLLLPWPALSADLPEGLDGLRWLAPVTQLPDAHKLAETPYYQCFRSGDGTGTFGGAPISNKRLCFAGDRFYFAQMEFSGQQAYQQMLTHARSLWGDGRAAERFTQTTLWGSEADPVYVELEYSPVDQRGTLALVYLPVYRETQEASRQQRARARAGAGF